MRLIILLGLLLRLSADNWLAWTFGTSTYLTRRVDHLTACTSVTTCISIAKSSEVYCTSTNMSAAGEMVQMVLPSHLKGEISLSTLSQGGPQDCQPLRIAQALVIVQAMEESASIGSFVLAAQPEYGVILRSRRLEIGVQTVFTGLKGLSSDKGFNVMFDALGVSSLVLPPSTEVIETKVDSLDPGSLFFTVSTIDGEGMRSAPSVGYLEYVLPDEEIGRHRRFVSDSERAAAISASAPHTEGVKTNVCFFGADIMDGQRSIWLAQSQHMSGGRGDLSFTWILGEHAGEGTAGFDARSSVRHRLQSMQHVRVLASPGFELRQSELSDVPGDGRPPASAVWDNNVEKLFQYAHESLLAYNYDIDAVQPDWCRRIYQRMRAVLQHGGQPCGVVVYGNTRLEGNEVGGDVVITDTARALGIPTVAELMNLFVSSHILPTAIVAPSSYALEHDSVQSVLGAPAQAGGSTLRGARAPPMGLVIAPAVDTVKFDPARYQSMDGATAAPAYRHPACTVQGLATTPCAVVGFIARLAPEKNPGLFLLAARELLRLHPFARFTVVGDGVLRASLEDLAARLQISWAVHFTGWVGGDDLPGVLAGLDVLVNPSLRAWSETFCIANIEAMSMAVPLVTFAVGGVGEYVEQPAQDGTGDAPFSVSENAVVVHRATPVAIAEAVHHLILHPELRRALGQAGRRTVVSHFTIASQMSQYAALYAQLAADKA